MVDKKTSKNKIALVIGSGGIKCASAIGLWRVLQREGIEPDLLVGCSAGSLYAACIGLGFSVEKMEQLTLKIWTQEVMKDYVSNLKATQGGGLRFNERSGLVDDTYMNEQLAAVFSEYSFEDSAIPLQVVATDLNKGEQVTLTKGKIFDALRASLAIPVIFPPHEVDGRLLTDGGASDPLPVDVAIREGAELIIAMGFTLSYRNRMRSITAVQAQMTNIYMNNILRATFAFHNLAHHSEIIPFMPEFEEPLGMFDTDKLPEIIAVGERTAEEQLPYIKRFLSDGV